MNFLLMLCGVGLFSFGAIRQFGGAPKKPVVKAPEEIKPVDPIAEIKA